ncbi:SDR family NAD(P)-dependent oxidoreductase [Sphingomonas sp. GB1N7]|uniref:SDR family NAD(P)-dependent oxidoreductase n=1 Tax=Parasphingomonas caseinilytica TaxID=3096158 RepID=UPI002FCC7373
MGRFSDTIVLVTGGTSGIGLAIAEAFLAQGASVAICARSESILAQFRTDHPTAFAVRADIIDPTAQSALLDAVISHFGRLDILVNNAGGLVEHDFMTAPPAADALADDLALNLLAPIQLTSAVLARCSGLRALIFVTSGYALVAPRRSPTYGAAKAGLRAFLKALRRQVGTRNLHVLEVLPPSVDTPAIAHRKVKKVSPQSVAQATLDALAARRPEALVGQVRVLPMMLRIAPGMIERLVAEE